MLFQSNRTDKNFDVKIEEKFIDHLNKESNHSNIENLLKEIERNSRNFDYLKDIKNQTLNKSLIDIIYDNKTQSSTNSTVYHFFIDSFAFLFDKNGFYYFLFGLIAFFILGCVICIYLARGGPVTRNRRLSKIKKIKKTNIKNITLQPNSLQTKSISQIEDSATSPYTHLIDDSIQQTIQKLDQEQDLKKEDRESNSIFTLKETNSKSLDRSATNNSSQNDLLSNDISKKKESALKLMMGPFQPGTQINQQATERIKKFMKKKTQDGIERASKPQPSEEFESKRLEKYKLRYAIVKDDTFEKSNNKSMDRSTEKSIDKSNEKSNSRTNEILDEQTLERKEKIKAIVNEKSKKRSKKRLRKLRRKSNRTADKKKKTSNFRRSSSGRNRNRNQMQPSNDEFDMCEMKIYNKTIEFKFKPNELVSVLQEIPSLEAKVPSSKILLAPPSLSTLRKGRPIKMSSSSSSSDELVTKFHHKSKKKLKTKSTEPMLDGELH